MLAKTPFYFSEDAKVPEIFTDEVIKSLQENPSHVIRHPLLAFTLDKQPLDKKLYRVITRTYTNSTTGETVEVVESASTIQAVADFARMTDFSLIVEKCNRDLLNICKDYLSQRQPQPLPIEQVAGYLRPTVFLDACNLQPPTCDFFQALDRRVKPRKMGLSVLFDDSEVPQVSKFRVTPEIANSKLYEALSEYFAKRPIWTRNVLINQLHSSNQPYRSNELKNCLQYIAYYYKDGPWKHAYVRFGYDPRTDRNSVAFQVVTLRFKHKMVEDYENEQPEDQMFDPTFSRLDQGKAVRSYQLCDIVEPRVKELLSLNLAGPATECDKQVGWLTKSERRTIYRLLKMKLP